NLGEFIGFGIACCACRRQHQILELITSWVSREDLFLCWKSGGWEWSPFIASRSTLNGKAGALSNPYSFLTLPATGSGFDGKVVRNLFAYVAWVWMEKNTG